MTWARRECRCRRTGAPAKQADKLDRVRPDGRYLSVESGGQCLCRRVIEPLVAAPVQGVLDQRAGEEAQQGSRRRHDDLPELPALPDWTLQTDQPLGGRWYIPSEPSEYPAALKSAWDASLPCSTSATSSAMG